MPELKSETKLPRPSFKKLNSDITEINGEKKLESVEPNTGPEFTDKKTHTRIVEAACPEEESDGSHKSDKKQQTKEEQKKSEQGEEEKKEEKEEESEEE